MNNCGLAQSVERGTHNPEVGDSSSPPATITNRSPSGLGHCPFTAAFVGFESHTVHQFQLTAIAVADDVKNDPEASGCILRGSHAIARDVRLSARGASLVRQPLSAVSSSLRSRRCLVIPAFLFRSRREP